MPTGDPDFRDDDDEEVYTDTVDPLQKNRKIVSTDPKPGKVGPPKKNRKLVSSGLKLDKADIQKKNRKLVSSDITLDKGTFVQFLYKEEIFAGIVVDLLGHEGTVMIKCMAMCGVGLWK
ncbi:hypothetical protein QYM36_012844 [Artemia franciscana]|uniref:DUF7072 domain-containing protein n=1 Tax=Artemia franciscana TaxID=6661 RepID=A0AA88HX46_ARTSF|nr:hypothetical protein QYM36_012844 [Artemia franciscana]